MARDPAEIVRLTSTVRAVEAAGGAVASGISSTHAPVSLSQCYFMPWNAYSRQFSDTLHSLLLRWVLTLDFGQLL